MKYKSSLAFGESAEVNIQDTCLTKVSQTYRLWMEGRFDKHVVVLLISPTSFIKRLGLRIVSSIRTTVARRRTNYLRFINSHPRRDLGRLTSNQL